MNKIVKFLKSKIKTEYGNFDIVPWYKSLLYYDVRRNKNVCVVIPLNIVLAIIRDIYWSLRLFGIDRIKFYERQFKLRNKEYDKFK